MIPRQVSIESSAGSSSINSYSPTISQPLKKNEKGGKKRSPVFPKRLFNLLDNAEIEGYSHLISWCNDGNSFKIHSDNEEEFLPILKRNFNQTRFKSFVRQLQLYGFERQFKGSKNGECRHPLLVRGRRDLLHKKSIDDFQKAATMAPRISPILASTIGGSTLSSLSSSNSNLSSQPPKFFPPPLTSLSKKKQSLSPTLTAFQENYNGSTSNNSFCSSDDTRKLPTRMSYSSSLEYCQMSSIPTTLVNLILPEEINDGDYNDNPIITNDHNNGDHYYSSMRYYDEVDITTNSVFNRNFFDPSDTQN